MTSAIKTRTIQTSDSVSLKFDRRHETRYPVSGQITILRCDHDPEAYQHPINSLQLKDMCNGGLAAKSDTVINQNERVAIYFPPKDNKPGFDLAGHVVRCLPDKKGYTIAIQFDAKRAA